MQNYIIYRWLFFLGLHLLLELLVLVGVNSLFDLCLLLEFFVLEDVSFVFDLCLFLEFFCTWGFGLRVWHCICYLSFLYLGMSVVCLLVHVIYIFGVCFLKGLQNNTHVEDLTFCHFSHFRGCKLDFRCFIVCFGSVVP